jgi:DNA repair protein RecO (recombination protein O)
MEWNDKGYLLSKNKYNENSIIVEIFTLDHGKTSGIIFGASSKKIKNYLEIGNKLHVNYNYKNENRLGYFKVEIIKATSPLFFDDKKRLLCINSAINLIKILTVDLQKNKSIYELIESFFVFLSENDWVARYILWELQLLKLLGYDLELKNLVNKEIINDEIIYFVEKNSKKKIIPNFLIDLNYEKLDIKIILSGLQLVGDYLEKSILKPNNMNYPSSRTNFINLLK